MSCYSIGDPPLLSNPPGCFWLEDASNTESHSDDGGILYYNIHGPGLDKYLLLHIEALREEKGLFCLK